MINVFFGTFVNLITWITGYVLTHWLFTSIKAIYEDLDCPIIKDRYIFLCWLVGIILLGIYTYLVYKFHWYINVF